MSRVSTVYPMQSDQIWGYTPGGYPIGDRAIDSQDLADLDREIYVDGIISTAEGSGAYYQVAASGGMNLTVNPGKCYIRGRKAATPAITHLIIENADPLINRTDRVVLRLDLSNPVRDVVIAVKRGTTELTRTSSVWELGLADVRVDRAATSIPQSAVTDLRFNSAICGRAFNELLRVDTTGIFNQIQSLILEHNTRWQLQTDEQRRDHDLWRNQINEWAALTVTELAKAVSMNMDNLGVYPGTTYTCSFPANGDISERLAYTSGGVLAERLTVFTSAAVITQTLSLFNPNGSVFLRTISTTAFNGDGSITTSIVTA